MPEPLSPSAQKVQDTLSALGLTTRVVELPESTRTAERAAKALDCELGQIAKSLVFKVKRTRHPLLVIASGANRVNVARLRELVGERVIIAHPDYVRKHTGFSIGGVPPVGHTQVLRTLIDEDLMRYDRIWASAGTPNAVFELDPRDLEEMTGGAVIGVT